MLVHDSATNRESTGYEGSYLLVSYLFGQG
jgi:hypothetical protein